jgi:hypothetical protein
VHKLATKWSSAHADYKVVGNFHGIPTLLEGNRGFYPSAYGPPGDEHPRALRAEAINAEVRRVLNSSTNEVSGLVRFSSKYNSRAFIRSKADTIRFLRNNSDKTVPTTIYPERIFCDWVQALKRTEQAVYSLLEEVIAKPHLKSRDSVEAVKGFAFQFSSRSYEVRPEGVRHLPKAMKNKCFQFLRINTTC